MVLQYITLIGDFNFTLNDTGNANLNNLTSFVNLPDYGFEKNNIYLKNVKMATRGCVGLRKKYNSRVINGGVFLNAIPIGNVFSYEENTFVDSSNMIMFSKNITIHDFNVEQNLGFFIKPEFTHNNKRYMADTYHLVLTIAPSGPFNPNVAYDPLNIDPTYLDRQCSLQFLFNIDRLP